MYASPEPFTPNTDLKMDPRSRGPLYKLLFSNVPKKVIAFTLFVSILLSYFLVLGGLNAAFDTAYPQFRGQAPMRFGADVFDYAFLADDISRGQFRRFCRPPSLPPPYHPPPPAHPHYLI